MKDHFTATGRKFRVFMLHILNQGKKYLVGHDLRQKDPSWDKIVLVYAFIFMFVRCIYRVRGKKHVEFKLV